MSRLIFVLFLFLLNLQAGFLLASTPASLTRIQNFGSNPSGVMMYIYVPKSLPPHSPIVVAIHYCKGSAWEFYRGTPYAQLADEYGFLVIYPSSPHSGACWDVSSTKSLTHNGGGDSNAIANMISYTLANYDADPKRVFVLGSSSGAMMTNVLAATYPELFTAAVAYSGVPAGCFSSSGDIVNAWNSSCASGQISTSSAYWSDIVQQMYPSFNGTEIERPRMQVYHGSLDTTLAPELLGEEIKQWAGVFSLDANTPEDVDRNSPMEGWTTSVWGIDAENPMGKLRGVWAREVGHPVPVEGSQDMMWFGLGPYASIYANSNMATNTSAGNTAPKPMSTASARKLKARKASRGQRTA